MSPAEPTAISTQLAELRKDYALKTLEERGVDRDPLRQFGVWMVEAIHAQVPEPTAMTLATVSAENRPAGRIVLLKGVDPRGFVFYTNYESRKGGDLLAHPQAAMCFHWQPLERQVRVEGRAGPVDAAEADAYFASRARGSQIGAWASKQSRAIPQPGELEQRVREMEARFAGGPVPRPPHWSGFRLVPARIEFWRGMPSRLHERHVYTRDGDGWRTTVLYP
jgi:pyridoxamine 5'-phosphate oxidase